MPTQAEEQRKPQQDEAQSASPEAVHSRVSELLDNATVVPEDDFAKEARALEDEPQHSAGDSTVADAPSTDGAAPTGGPAAALPVSEDADSVGASTTGGQPPAESTASGGEDGTGESPITGGESGAQANAADQESSRSEPTETADGDVLQSTEPVYLGEDDKMSPSSVRIRGRPGGVLVEIEDAGSWTEILKLLEERLDAAEGFFRGGKAVVEVGTRDVYEDELRQARDMLARHDMTLAVVRSTSDLTLQSSLLLGLSTSNQAERVVEQPDRDMAPVVPITQPKSPYFVHNGTLRSGQVLRKSESIMIVGDVNPGAKVISGGDVMVWGRLRGMAYAGASGNKDARVAAIEFSPTQLRIASVTAVPPDAPKKRGLRFWRKPVPEKRPEVAHVSNGHIVVEPWDDSRPGRPRVARR